jgi:hypothetical protein
MNMLKKLQAKVRRWAQGTPRGGPRRARPVVEALEDRVVPAALVLGSDGNLWQEDPGWQNYGRTLIDGNVRGFAQGNDGYMYVLGTDGNLWQEYPHWQLTNGRTWVDGNVRSFARGNDGYDYVLGTDGNLWKELPRWRTYGRTWVDGNVRSFARGNDGYDYVLGTDGNLWQELPGWRTYGRTWVDGNVRSFARGNDGYDYVLGIDGNLWQELPGWQSNGRTWVDGKVRSFAIGGDGYDYVLGTDLNLWKEQPYWSYYGRTWVDGNVQRFTLGNDGYDYVMGTDGNLWQELPGWGYNGRSWVDGNVRGFVAGCDGYFLALTPRPAASAAYSPVSGTLFNPNTNAPSYLDVQQGVAQDCWLMASFAETAARVPADIQNMFLYEGSTVDNGTVVNVYSVRLYDGSGTAQYVTVDTELPGGGTYYDRPVGGSGAVNGSPSPVLWAALAEKAYVEANAYGLVTTGNGNSYSYGVLNGGGYPSWALQAITGQAANDYGLSTADVAWAWNRGMLVVLGTPKTPGPNANPYIVSWHAYAVVGYVPNMSDHDYDLYELFNPWGTDSTANFGWAPGYANSKYGLFWADAFSLPQNFTGESFGVGAAPGPREGRHAGSSQELADLAFIAGLLDPYAKHRAGGGASPTSTLRAVPEQM